MLAGRFLCNPLWVSLRNDLLPLVLKPGSACGVLPSGLPSHSPLTVPQVWSRFWEARKVPDGLDILASWWNCVLWSTPPLTYGGIDSQISIWAAVCLVFSSIQSFLSLLCWTIMFLLGYKFTVWISTHYLLFPSGQGFWQSIHSTISEKKVLISILLMREFKCISVYITYNLNMNFGKLCCHGPTRLT